MIVKQKNAIHYPNNQWLNIDQVLRQYSIPKKILIDQIKFFQYTNL